ncbi:glycine-rich domain-containing protein [Tautonia sp. JC769]|uniref:glycine-rich domain-containing protein n=1 Tax=Tautonia sp. JC769 TaxID=3232135 RepID=UPI00345996EA
MGLVTSARFPRLIGGGGDATTWAAISGTTGSPSDTTVDGHRVLRFEGAGSVTFGGAGRVEYEVIGGGGSGGCQVGGAGGGAGRRKRGVLEVAPGTYTVEVGAGGAGASLNNRGNDGSPSRILSGATPLVEAIGGGGGGATQFTNNGLSGRDGGSGGGGPGKNPAGSGGINPGLALPSEVMGEGFDGGQGLNQDDGARRVGAGGGGAGGRGQDATDAVSGFSPGLPGGPGAAGEWPGAAGTNARGGDGCPAQFFGDQSASTSPGYGSGGGGRRIAPSAPGAGGVVVIWVRA